MDLISRQEAKAQSLLHYYTGKPCLRGHVSERFVSTRTCCACRTENSQTPEAKAADKARQQTPDTRAYQAAYRQTPEAKAKQAAYAAAHAAANPERRAASRAAWNAANPAARAAIRAQRRAAKIQRTPKWLTPADKAAIKAIYEQCAFTSRVTGQAHHVDHILPLRGETVSGLHVPLNLQILTAAENLTKSYKLLEQLA